MTDPYFQDASLTIWHGRSEIVLKEFENDSIDSVVCDPPYELGFMNRGWDANGIAYSVPLWQEVLRVLKPGGHLLAFGGTRTYHRMTCAVEDAGFEIRDSIHWIFGSGFPKSHNVALGIDKMLGGDNRGRAIPTAASTYQASDIEEKNRLTSNPVGAYESKNPESEPWQGFGTALKPAYEPIVVARKPLIGTVAKNVLVHGTGALNIDACRIGMSRCDAEYIAERIGGFNNTQSIGGNGMYGGGETMDRSESYDAAKGRWPANIILSHHEECIELGTKTVEGRTINRWDDGAKPFGGGAGHEFTSEKQGDDVVAIYECVLGCPIAELNKQSGHLKSGNVAPGGFTGPYTADIYGKYAQNQIRPEVVYADEDGASRFFQQFNGRDGEATADKSYADEGSTSFAMKPGMRRNASSPSDYFQQVEHNLDESAGFFYSAKASKSERNLGLSADAPESQCGDGRTVAADNAYQRGTTFRKNPHPTVKPLDLMRYLIKLVTPPSGVVLDPFAGSGTTLIAAFQEKFACVGIEQSEEYCNLIATRLKGVILTTAPTLF